MPDPHALLLDLDGTLYTDAGAIAGAVETVAELRRRGRSVRFVTNTTRRSRRGLADRLRGYGFQVRADEIFTSVMAGVHLLHRRGITGIAPFVAQSTLEDFSEFELVGGTAPGPVGRATPAAVVVGDLGDRWTPALLNEAFRLVLDGALLVALQKDRYWLGPTGLELDAGPYVSAIEYATGQEAVICGKPNAQFYLAALANMPGPPPGPHAAMIGDDLWADVAGAQRAGLQGWLVRTGKFRQGVLEASGIKPDRMLNSVADVLSTV
jgi:HAD superfamily hydrolase (TIGR01458 family)